MSEAVVPYQTSSTAIEAVIAKGDLGKLTAEERVSYYLATCRSLGLNELTKPFEYITLNGKLTLYATRTAADQLRKENGVSIAEPVIEYRDDMVIVKVNAADKAGRTDSDLGAVFIGALKGVDKANAIMKAITKAKRRVTLSICGLGWADETEIETIPNAHPVNVDATTGEILDVTPEPAHTNGGGKAASNYDGPTKPSDAMAYINSRVEVPYDNIPHLFNAIKGEMGGVFSWPGAKDLDAWAIAIDTAIRHANAKVQTPEPQSPPAGLQKAMELQGEQAQATIDDGMRGDYEEGK